MSWRSPLSIQYDTQRRLGLAGRLGPGEAAVMAIAINRNWAAVIDDGSARSALRELSAETQILSCQILLRTAVVALELIDSAEAQIIYDDLLSGGFRGPDTLWKANPSAWTGLLSGLVIRSGRTGRAIAPARQ